MGLLGIILVFVTITTVISILAASFIRSNALCIIASAAIAEMLTVLYGLIRAAKSSDAHDILLGVNITLIVGTPIFIGTAIAATLLARRLYRKRPPSN